MSKGITFFKPSPDAQAIGLLFQRGESFRLALLQTPSSWTHPPLPTPSLSVPADPPLNGGIKLIPSLKKTFPHRESLVFPPNGDLTTLSH